MLNRIREARKNESGFTLIELLIVIIVLGILAAIVLFALGTFESDSDKAACEADVKQVRTAATAYAAANDGAWPDDIDDDLVGDDKYLQEAPDASYGIDLDTDTKSVTDGCDSIS